jgi:integrase
VHLRAQAADGREERSTVASVGLQSDRGAWEKGHVPRGATSALHRSEAGRRALHGPHDIEDEGINVVQQKTRKELWVPLHADLRGALAGWSCSPFVQTPKGESYTPERFRSAWTRLMNDTPAGRIRKEGFTFHGLRASSVEKLREAGCGDREIESITGMSPAMVTRYSRHADQKRLAKAAVRRLEGRTVSERKE